jgi:hypothetical protein
MAAEGPPVIEHLQASRQLKHKIGAKEFRYASQNWVQASGL